MTNEEIANRLVELCRTSQYDQAYAELFAENAVNIEPEHTQMPPAVGLAALKQKTEQFRSMIKEMHGGFVSDPLIAGNYFTLTMGVDYTNQEGARVDMKEVCVYEVQDGKIVKEYGFYDISNFV